MVERYDARGHHSHEVFAWDDFKAIVGNYRRMIFYQDGVGISRREAEILEELRGYPGFDRDSFLIINSLGGREGKSPVHVLLVPHECPFLGQNQAPVSENELYIATGWEKTYPDRVITDFILADSKKQAANVASRKIGDFLKIGSNRVGIRVEQVTRSRFIDEAKRSMRMGRRLPAHIMRIPELKAFEEELAAAQTDWAD